MFQFLRRTTAKILAASLLMSIICGQLQPGPAVQAANVPGSGLQLSDSTYYFASDYFSAMPTGAAPVKQLTVTDLPAGVTNEEVAWSSSDSSVATVDQSGLVTAAGKGTALITASAAGSLYRSSCAVYVPSISESFDNLAAGDAWGITTGNAAAIMGASASTITGIPGQVFKAAYSASGTRGFYKTFAAPVANEKVLLNFDWNVGTLTNGAGSLSIQDSMHRSYITFALPLTGTATGSRTIIYDTTPTTTRGTPYTLPEESWGTQKGKPVAGSGFDTANATYNVTVAIDFLNKKIDFTLTNKTDAAKTASVRNIPFSTAVTYSNNFGAIEMLGIRTSSTATWNPWLDNFNVYTAVPDITSVSLNTSELKLSNITAASSSTAQLTATVNPAVPDVNQNVTWSSSDTAVATVSATGVVNAVYDGIATITAVSVKNPAVSSTAIVTVRPPIEISELHITDAGVNVEGTAIGKTTGTNFKLDYTIHPADADYQSVRWSSSDPAVVNVGATSGMAYVLAPGDAEIMLTADAFAEYGGPVITRTFTVHATGEATAWVPVEEVTLDHAVLTLNARGANGVLNASIGPVNATNQNLIWTTSDAAVARVSSGVITPVSSGIAVITVATDDGNFTASCTVTVNVGVTGLALDRSSLSLTTPGGAGTGLPGTLTPVIYPADASIKDVIWTTSNPAVATVDNGIVTPAGGGTAIITATSADGGYTASSTVTVAISVNGISLAATALELSMGGLSGDLTTIIQPLDAANKNVIWTTSDAAVATVSGNGIVTPVNTGTARITVKTADGSFSATCEVTVSPAVALTALTLDQSSLLLPSGGVTRALTPGFSPAEASNTSLTWTTSDASVATVLNGVVTSVAPGTATITAASAEGGLTADSTVTVIPPNGATITNDTFYKDTDGNPIYSQGGGIFKFGDTYYWYGVHYKEAETYAQTLVRVADRTTFMGFSCYSSKDLVHWKNEGDVMTRNTPGAENATWVGRMGVAYNQNTQKYVLLSQFYYDGSDGGEGGGGLLFAVSNSPAGPFTIDHIQSHIPGISDTGPGTGDQSLFIDDDGLPYLIASSPNGRSRQYVVPLEPADFLSLGPAVQISRGQGLEGNAMFKYDGNYYFASSDLHGWNASHSYVFQASNILGPYSPVYVMEGTDASFSHVSQTGFFLTVKGTEGSTVIYAGDRWSNFAGNGLGYNQWVPLSFDGSKPVFNDLSQWTIDAEAGTWASAPGNNYVSNPTFEADRVVTSAVAGWTVTDNVSGAANSNLKGSQYSGNFVYQQKAATPYIAALSQVVSDLPDGSYTLKAWVKSSGGQNAANLYAKNYGGEAKAVSVKTAVPDWTEVVIKNIVVTDGEMEIGLYSDALGGQWVQIDNLSLTKDAVSVSGVELDHAALQLTLNGEQGVLTPLMAPHDATITGIIWSTSNPEVVTVEAGVVTAAGLGTATVTATTVDGGYKAASRIKVVPSADASLSGISVGGVPLADFSPGTLDYRFQLAAGTLTAPQVSATAANSGASIAYTQAAAPQGQAVILVTAADGSAQTYTVQFIVPGTAVTGVKLSQNSADIKAGESRKLSATVMPADATNAAVLWSSDNESVAAVEGDGTVTGIAAGMAIIKVTTADGGFSDTAAVTVTAAATAAVPADGLASSSGSKAGAGSVSGPAAGPANSGQSAEPAGLGQPASTQPGFNDKVNPDTVRLIAERGKKAPPVTFTDVNPDSWSAQLIERASRMGMVSGFADGLFKPAGKVTRAEFAVMVVRAFGLSSAGGSQFTDTQAHWAVNEIAVLRALGISSGYSDGSFHPNQQITRAEIVGMLARLVDYAPAAKPAFSDTASSWAAGPIEAFAAYGIVSGAGEGKFMPNASASRAEAVAIIVRMIDRLVG
ncbi:Ig-like domain-containing protein [Paenibacillus sp. MMS20-IR301]|uniref:Ig-like domain-containing protein n=1 Tax=Paenibacillus sp. MMS20-IR301 TaxID=2895946 RepID=UPI0028EB53D5|nr:Ig-like domain-containing protein [Paenibacillus sp. MMS20-IR301]WNS44039.1 Ig-like domain-containing protein [Paenibacillus sp. MMS20-IR301]